MIRILRMMAFIFYRIYDLPDYLIVWLAQSTERNTFGQGGSAKGRIRQLMKTNGKRASSKAGNKNSSERRMMMNADGFHSDHGVLTRPEFGSALRRIFSPILARHALKSRPNDLF